MIGQLEGVVVYQGERYIIVDVGGVGYRVFASAETRSQLESKQEPVRLWTHLAVREDALDLYGFNAKAELDTFELLLAVSGVGPKSALAILSLAPPETLHKAISAGDTDYLTRVSGIGRKIAEKIVIELRDKVSAIASEAGEGTLAQEADAVEGLKSLGYSLREAREALRQVPPQITDTGEKIKEALRHLGK